jgi:hypothetical protein
MPSATKAAAGDRVSGVRNASNGDGKAHGLLGGTRQNHVHRLPRAKPSAAPRRRLRVRMNQAINAMPRLCSWSQCTGCDSPVRAGDPTAARRWVGCFIGDETVMARLRLLAIMAGADTSPVMLDDQALADRIASDINSGVLRVCGAASALTLYGLVSIKVPAAAPAAPAPAPTAPRASPVAAPPPVDTTFSADIDVEAMVAVLRAAAEAGVPFCEECARRAAKKAIAGAAA